MNPAYQRALAQLDELMADIRKQAAASCSTAEREDLAQYHCRPSGHRCGKDGDELRDLPRHQYGRQDHRRLLVDQIFLRRLDSLQSYFNNPRLQLYLVRRQNLSYEPFAPRYRSNKRHHKSPQRLPQPQPQLVQMRPKTYCRGVGREMIGLVI